MSGWPSPTRDEEPIPSFSNPYYDLIDSPEIPKGELYGHDPRQTGQREIPPPRETSSYSRPVSPPPLQARVPDHIDTKPRRSRWDVAKDAITTSAQSSSTTSISSSTSPRNSTKHLPPKPHIEPFSLRPTASTSRSSLTPTSHPAPLPSTSTSSRRTSSPTSTRTSLPSTSTSSSRSSALLNSSSSTTPRKPPPPQEKLPPFFYKSLNTKDYKVLYDPSLDTNPVKKGKEVVYRWDGDKYEGKVEDPRKGGIDFGATKDKGKKKKREIFVDSFGIFSYSWDKNSLGPPPPIPPSAILITEYPSTVTPDAIHSHFRSFGKIETQDFKYDTKTGGSLGVCWIKYQDDIPRNGRDSLSKEEKEQYDRKRRAGQTQDGANVANEALQKSNGAKVGMAMMMSSDKGVKVVLDGKGELCKEAVKKEMERLHPEVTKPRPSTSSSNPRPPSDAALPPPPPLPSIAPPAPPSQPPPPPPSIAPPPLHLPARPNIVSPVNSPFRFGSSTPTHSSSATPSGPRSSTTSSSSLPTGPRALARGPPSGPRSSTYTSSMSAAVRGPGPFDLAVPQMQIPPLPPSSSSSSLPPKPILSAVPPAPAPIPTGPSSNRERTVSGGGGERPPLRSEVGRGGGGSSGFGLNRSNGSTSHNNGRLVGGGRGQAEDMASAIAKAVEAAKKRLKQQQLAQQQQRQQGGGNTTARVRSPKKRLKELEDEDVDMEMSEESTDEDGDEEGEGEGDGSEEEKVDKKDRVFFHHGSGRTLPRTVLPHGVAPAAAIAWQASKKVLEEKLALNGKSYLLIEKEEFQRTRNGGHGGSLARPNGEELERHFKAFGIDRTFADSSGWYITFTSSTSAQKALDELNYKRFSGAPLVLTLCEPPSLPTPKPTESNAEPSSANEGPKRHFKYPKPPTPVPDAKLASLIQKLNQKPKKTSGWTDQELVDEAKKIIVQELLDAFENDIKLRVVRGKVQEHLSSWEKTQTNIEPPRRQPPLPPPPAPYVKPEAPIPSMPSPFAPPSTVSESTPQPSSIKGGLATLSFAKRNKGQNGTTTPRNRQRSVSRISSEAPSETSVAPAPQPQPHDYLRDHDMSEEEEEEVEKPVKRPVGRPRKHPLPPNGAVPTNTKKGRKPARIVSESEGEETKARRKKQEDKDKKKRDKEKEKKTKKAKVHLSYTSSEGEDGEEEEEEETRDLDPPPLRMEDLVSRSTSPELNMKPIEEYRRERSGEVEEEEEEAEPSFLKKLMKRKHGLSSLAEEDDAMQVDGDVSAMPTPDATAPSPSLHGPEEEEDEDSGSDSDRGLSPATIRARRLRRASALATRPVTSDPFEAGIAADEEDLFYLKLAIERLQLGHDFQPTPPGSEDESNNLKHPSGCARTEGFYKVTIEEKMANRPASNRAKAATDNGASAVAVSRLARANTRGLVRGMELHKKVTATDTDVLKFNQLKTRKKQLTFSRSGIEGYGLFAKEHIPQGDMVIEYVGELIRQQVADLREKAYERQGIGSSYLFRVDEDLVVDATKKGNLGRLINHCCAPNCTAKIITINGVKKIVIYAKTVIEPGDEVTYDYHFPIEEDNKIPCLCGAPTCRRYLN